MNGLSVQDNNAGNSEAMVTLFKKNNKASEARHKLETTFSLKPILR
jgi:hypothetical protein